MSHPIPGHEYGESEHDEHSSGPRGKALRKKIKPFAKGIKGLKQMVNQSASKHWFARVNK